MSNPTTQKATVATAAPKPTPAPANRRGAPSTKTPAELAAQRQKAQADMVRNLQRSVDRACGAINGAGGSVGKRLGLYRGLPLPVREAAVAAVEERVKSLRLLLGTATAKPTTPSLAAILVESGAAKTGVAPAAPAAKTVQ